MALDHLLHLLHRVRVPGDHVEARSASQMGCYRCFWLVSLVRVWISIKANMPRGVMAVCQAAAQNWQGMMALRFFLGLFEAAFGPGIPYLMSFFYRRSELGFRCGLFVSAAPLASTFAGALAYGITSGHPLLSSWRLLFLVEGVPTLVGAVLAWFFLPDGPASANFLTAEEKEVACTRSLRRGGETDRVSGIDWKDLGKTLLDPKPFFTAVCLPTLLLSIDITR